MVIDEKILTALMNGEFILECKEIKLIPMSSAANKPIHVGPGSITQSNDGSFLIKAYCQGDIHLKEVLGFFDGIPGKLINDEEYYNVQAIDFNGNSWQVGRALPPDIISGPSSSGYIIKTYCMKLSTRSTAPITSKADLASIFYRGNITIPANTVKKTEIKIGDRMHRTAYNRSVASFEAAEIEFEVASEPNYLRLDAISERRAMTYSTVMRISEALQFVLGRILPMTCIELWEKNTKTTILSASQKNERKSRIEPPIAVIAVDRDSDVWALFNRYLSYVLSYEKEQWHPIFRRIYSVIKSGEASIEAEGLTLSVAIEGLVNELFPKVALPSEEFERKVKEALSFISSASELDDRVKKRVNGFIGNTLMRPRARDRLYTFRDQGLIDAKLIDDWESLRNPATHGDPADLGDIQRYINKCSSALVLFYQLIFLAIGYTSKFTNYSAYGYPVSSFHKILA